MKKTNIHAGVYIPASMLLENSLNSQEKIILAQICQLDNAEFGCIAKNDFFAEIIGISTSAIQKILKKLEDLGFILRSIFDEKRIIKITEKTQSLFIGKSTTNCPTEEETQPMGGWRNVRGGVEKSAGGGGKNSTSYIYEQEINKNLKKEKNIKKRKNEEFDFSEEEEKYFLRLGIDKKSWLEFVEMRRKMKSEMSINARALALKKLEKLKKDGEDVLEVIEQSIICSYKGLFPVSGNFKKEKKQGNFESSRDFSKMNYAPVQNYEEF